MSNLYSNRSVNCTKIISKLYSNRSVSCTQTDKYKNGAVVSNIHAELMMKLVLCKIHSSRYFINGKNYLYCLITQYNLDLLQEGTKSGRATSTYHSI